MITLIRLFMAVLAIIAMFCTMIIMVDNVGFGFLWEGGSFNRWDAAVIIGTVLTSWCFTSAILLRPTGTRR